MRATLRSAGWTLMPGVMANRAARYERGLREVWGSSEHARRFVARHGDRVLHGPLAGMRYRTDGDVAVAKLLGVYEEEIVPWISEAIAAQPATFVDLGAADGYWAVGFASASPATAVHAFELSAIARDELAETAGMNAVELTVHRRATAKAVGALPLADAVVLCDIEGAESTVLSPPLIKALGAATVIVELHEHLVPGVTSDLEARFRATHRCEKVQTTGRDPSGFPELECLDVSARAAAIDEHRGNGQMTFARFSPLGR
jgi:hypothetical protein